ncbi:hypothetical protein F4781DRAFT_435213 [Annulohypoxylon bovei var. microspora]|nr:hypothetical protein F4781DRAFT_435213 [Annulohypoxylon bovei var. microspora]
MGCSPISHPRNRGTQLIAEGKVAVRGCVEPVGYTKTGLRLSDGSVLDADAVIWCTGFADKDVRATASELFGAADPDVTDENGVLSPKDIVSRLVDASWEVDSEGEVRGDDPADKASSRGVSAARLPRNTGVLFKFQLTFNIY